MPEFNPIGAAIANAAQKHLNDTPLKFIDIPEWVVDDEPVRIWYRPMTIDERFDIYRYKSDAEDARYRQVYAIIRRALDSDGKRLFDQSHEIIFLKQADDGPVLRLAEALLASTPVAAAKKGSETTPSA